MTPDTKKLITAIRRAIGFFLALLEKIEKGEKI